LNYLALCDKLLKETGLSDQGVSSVIGQTGLNKKSVDWINRAWTEIQNLNNWDFLWNTSYFSTVIGQQNYDPVDNLALSPALHKWINSSVRITQSSGTGYLTYVPWATWVRTTFSSGKPTSFTIRPDNLISFNTLPDEIYTIYFDYYRTPQQLSTNTDELLLAEQFHDAVLYKAILYVAAEQDAPELYQDAQAQLNIRLSSMGVTALPAITLAERPVA
jgi:hypothetical protein